MRLVALTVSGFLAGLGLAAAIVGGDAVAHLRAALVAAHFTGAQEVSRRGDPDGRGRAVLKVYRTRVCSTIEVRGIEPATAAHIHLGFRREVGPIVATLKKPMAASSTTRTPVHRTASLTTPAYQTTAPVTTTVPQTTAFQATRPLPPRRPPRCRKPPPSGPTRALGRRGLSASSFPAAAWRCHAR